MDDIVSFHTHMPFRIKMSLKYINTKCYHCANNWKNVWQASKDSSFSKEQDVRLCYFKCMVYNFNLISICLAFSKCEGWTKAPAVVALL